VPHNIFWSPNGNQLAAGCGDGTIAIWNSNTGEEIIVLKGHTSYVRSLSWSPDGQRLVSASEDRTVRIWDPKNGRELLMLPIPDIRFPSISWSPDGRMISAIYSVGLIFDARKGYDHAPQLSAENLDH
jgi:WD40 repeat protein